MSQGIGVFEKRSIRLSRRGPKPSCRGASAHSAPLRSSAVFHHFSVSHFTPSVPLLIPSCFNLRAPLHPHPSKTLVTHVAVSIPFRPCPRCFSRFPYPPELIPLSPRLQPVGPPTPCLPSHPFITGPCSVNPQGFCLFVLELLLQLATDPTYFLTSHLNSRAALQLLHQLTYH